jgi:membrane fusion protein (multidrug efflux system)
VQQVVVVPTNAIKRNHFGEFVYRLEKDEQQNWRAKAIKVELGERVEDQQIILSGLDVGEFIATEGAFKLQENLLVYTQADNAFAAVGGNK